MSPLPATAPVPVPAGRSGGPLLLVGRLVVVLAMVVAVLAVPGPVPAAAAPAAPSRWQAPLPGPLDVARRFEAPPHPYAAGHRGVDLRGSAGEAVRAAGAGVVAFAGPVAGRGVVSVQHGPLRTTYEPVVAAVRVGRSVSAGTVLGHLAPVGGHCPPRACLHWGVRRGADYLDPLALLGAGRVRLLPVWGVGTASYVVGSGSARVAPARRWPMVRGRPVRGWPPGAGGSDGAGDGGPRPVAIGAGPPVLAGAVGPTAMRAVPPARAGP